MLMNLQCLRHSFLYSFAWSCVAYVLEKLNHAAATSAGVQEDAPEPEMLSNDHIDHHGHAASSSDAPMSISTATVTPEPTVE